jgi:hypothetical protein
MKMAMLIHLCIRERLFVDSFETRAVHDLARKAAYFVAKNAPG